MQETGREDGITLARLQAYIKAKDFQPGKEEAYFLKLVEEVGELAEALRKGRRAADVGGIKGSIEEELYDVLYYVAALANLHEVDLEQACREKEALNDRKYGRQPGGAC